MWLAWCGALERWEEWLDARLEPEGHPWNADRMDGAISGEGRLPSFCLGWFGRCWCHCKDGEVDRIRFEKAVQAFWLPCNPLWGQECS